MKKIEQAPDFWAADQCLQKFIRRRLPSSILDFAEGRLAEMGKMALTFFDPRAAVADRCMPVLKNYNRMGERIDEIEFHPAYTEMVERAYGAGLVWLHYDDELKARYGYVPYAFSFALSYLFAQAESGLFCPVCMTDGVARVLLKFGSRELKERFLPRLTAHTADELYQGAMFLTEKQGGSDVGANTARAVKTEEGWRLYGDKWFCSNAGAEAILALARPEGAPPGTRGLGLFLVPKYLEDGSRNSYRINRLKEKLGVRSMPTGEITLDAAAAYAIGEVERGFHYMAEMINLSRLYNAVASVALMRRAIYEAVSHALARSAFGSPIIGFPLMKRTLADLIVEHQASFEFVFEAVRLIDLIDSGRADAEVEKQLRLLTPLIKYHTAKQSVWAASEAMEVLGGNGYIEEFVTARLLRDAQVLPIWEGATNILVLDAARTIAKDRAHEPLLAALRARLENGLHFKAERNVLLQRIGPLVERIEILMKGGDEAVFRAKETTDEIVRLMQASLLFASADDEAGKVRAEYFFAKHFGSSPRLETAAAVVSYEAEVY